MLYCRVIGYTLKLKKKDEGTASPSYQKGTAAPVHTQRKMTRKSQQLEQKQLTSMFAEKMEISFMEVCPLYIKKNTSTHATKILKSCSNLESELSTNVKDNFLSMISNCGLIRVSYLSS